MAWSVFKKGYQIEALEISGATVKACKKLDKRKNLG